MKNKRLEKIIRGVLAGTATGAFLYCEGCSSTLAERDAEKPTEIARIEYDFAKEAYNQAS